MLMEVNREFFSCFYVSAILVVALGKRIFLCKADLGLIWGWCVLIFMS